MLIDMVATVTAGVGLAGIVLLLRKVLGDRMPAWAMPAAIGLGMISYATWSEYSWLGRTTAALPQGVTVIAAPQDRSILRPWTLAFPVSTRFMALDGTVLKTSVDNPAIRQAELMFVERWQGTRRVPIGFDCAKGAQADLTDGTTIAPDGTLSAGDWVAAAPGDPLQAAACQANGSSG
jgi:hypothetical protein